EVMVIAAALSIQDPRDRPLAKRQEAAESHARFADPDSDFLSYLRLWEYLREQQEALGSSAFRRLCRTEFLNHLRVREWQDIYGQLLAVTRGIGLVAGSPASASSPGVRTGIHRSVLSGLLSHMGFRSGPREDYQGARGARFALAPDSALFKRRPPWVMAAELVETNRLWARVVARVEPEWAEELGGHLIKRSYSEPQWDPERGATMAFERVALYGLPIVTSRKVDYGRVEPALARELFIHHALVEGDWRTRHRFVEDNQRLVEEVRALEARARGRDVLVDDEARFDFYDQRVGQQVTSAGHFDRWWKQERSTRPHLLHFSRKVLINPEAGDISPIDYPETWEQGALSLPLSYEFDLGSESDGVTVHIALTTLNQVRATGFDWQVPGLRKELVTALIRSLPKNLRRNLIPAQEYAEAFLDGNAPESGPLHRVLAAELTRMGSEPVSFDAWQLDRVPGHLTMNFRVQDGDGAPLAMGKDLAALQSRFGGRIRDEVAEASRPLELVGLREWSFDTLPEVV
ncbi:MAG: DUF3418 domain-containing protein, partial [Acidimicrobiia bacterium]